MCSAEDDLRGAERDISYLVGVIDDLCERIEDCDRGILTLGELRREAGDFRGASGVRR